MSASLRDVADRAGVSVKTVSNVVNHYPHVRASTRDRVQQALAELNYRPNISARNLRRGRSGIVALALPELDIPYFAELARCIIKVAESRSWTVLLDQTDGLPDREAVVLDGIRDQLIDGLIFSPLASGRDELAGRRDDTPMVLLGERFPGCDRPDCDRPECDRPECDRPECDRPECDRRECDGTTSACGGPDSAAAPGMTPIAIDHVAIDNVAAARDATAHLISLGRRRIAAVGVQDDAPAATARQRLQGYRVALEDADIAADPSLLGPAGRYHRADGAAAMGTLLDSDAAPDAVFCFSDLLALGALRTILDRGLRVPEDVALMGFDDAEDGRYSTPTLSTIAPDKGRIAELAVDLLAARIDGTSLPETSGGRPRDQRAPYTLIARESTLGRG